MGKKFILKKKNLIEEAERAADKISVVIESDKVLSYSARIVKNVTVAPSPQWLQNKLMNAGIRPINNVVDVTNYVLLTYGQPMHAFDFDKFDGTTIVARNAENGEKLITLDGEERDLIADDLVIAVNDQPVALAGVMGGQSTEIGSSSKTVVLEAAVFNGTSIRKTSGRLNLRSESSSRFEKGINYDTVSEAMDFAAAMLQELAGGQVLSGQVTEGVLPTEPVEVSTTLGYVNTRLGTELTYTDIEEVFEKLGFAISGSEVKFTVLVPRRRWDIAIQADLVEEIARIYGYEKLPTTLPEAGATAGELTSMQRLRRRVRTVAEGAGLSEIITYALTTPEKAVQFSTQATNITELMWPMTVDRSALRQNVVSGMLDTIAYNVARKNSNLAVYEIGKVFEQTGNPKEDLPTEVETFTFALTGLVEEKDFQTKAKPVDFFYAKGIVEALFIKLKLDVTFVAQKGLASMHPGRTATILLDGKEIGFVGQVHPQTAKQYDIPETYVAEINLSTIESQMNQALIFEDITKYPSVSRDIALLLAESVSHHDIVSAIETSGVKRLTAIKLFDVYAGNNIAEGYKSMAYSLTFQNPNDNLTDEEVAKYMEKITKSLVEKVNAEIR